MLKTSKLLLPALIATLLSACDAPKQPQTEQTAAPAANGLPANHPPLTQAQTATAALGQLEGGIIKEVHSAGGYTYVKVERNGQEFWAAGPQANLEQGKLIGWYQGSVMRNFTSKSLNRTFEQINFVSQFVDPAQVMATQSRSQASVQQAPSQGGRALEVLNSGGYTYVKVEMHGKETWAAAPMTSVKVGDLVNWTDGSKMTNFTSSSLGRTFEEVYFVGSLNKGGAVGHTQGQGPAQAQSSGSVAEVITSAGYSYIQVTMADKQVWLAAPESNVKQNDKISWAGGSVMHNFQSRSLDKTFEEIIFVDAVSIN